MDELDSDLKFWIDYVENVTAMVLRQGDLGLETLFRPEKLLVQNTGPEFDILDHPRMRSSGCDGGNKTTSSLSAARRQFSKCADLILQQETKTTMTHRNDLLSDNEDDPSLGRRIGRRENAIQEKKKLVRNGLSQHIDENGNAITDTENEDEDYQITLPKVSQRRPRKRESPVAGKQASRYKIKRIRGNQPFHVHHESDEKIQKFLDFALLNEAA